MERCAILLYCHPEDTECPGAVHAVKDHDEGWLVQLRYDIGELEAENLRHGSADEPFNWEISI